MSTRCNIRIVNKEWEQSFMLYHHYDGYPSGVGMDLKRFLQSKERMQYWYATDIANQLIKGMHSEMYDKVDEHYEITNGLHGDAEYLYLIDCDSKTLTCYKVDWDDTEEDVYKKNRIREIKEE